MTALWLQLVMVAFVILVASQFLARSADAIGIKTGMGRSFVGVLLLATATSLPELGTGISSIMLVGEPDLAAGDAFGSNLFNLMIIGLLDLYWRNGSILNSVSSAPVLVAILGAGLISLAAIAIFLHGATSLFNGWYLSPISLIIAVLFVLGMYLIYRFDKNGSGHASSSVDGDQYTNTTLVRSCLLYAGSAAVVVGAAVVLANIGDSIAEEMGWHASFVGTLLLAFSTSLPELATCFAALRIRAPELAISNLLGSNVFNMGFVLFMDDLVYFDGTFWSGISQLHILTAVIAVFMSMIVAVSLLVKLPPRVFRFWTLEGATLFVIYIVASVVVFKIA